MRKDSQIFVRICKRIRGDHDDVRNGAISGTPESNERGRLQHPYFNILEPDLAAVILKTDRPGF